MGTGGIDPTILYLKGPFHPRWRRGLTARRPGGHDPRAAVEIAAGFTRHDHKLELET